ncbi:MAG: hypothetical protein ACR65U_00605 [Methylocystis sp.]
MEVNTEIHVPISLNANFANMSYFLVKSIAANAALPGDWRVVFTVSRDTDWDLDHPNLAWAKAYPVEFRWVDQAHWDALPTGVHQYISTILQRQTYEFKSDVVLFMDADTVVYGPLTELAREVATSDMIFGWPAWQPPGVDLNEVIVARGCALRDWGVTYSGYGLAFLSPKSCPPYFNFGFIAMSNGVARRAARDYPPELDFVVANYPDWFATQIALCLMILRNNYAFRILDMRYNFGNGDFPGQILAGPEADAAFARAIALYEDVRVVHYCAATEAFNKSRDMGSWERITRFCEREGLVSGNALLQKAFKKLL